MGKNKVRAVLGFFGEGSLFPDGLEEIFSLLRELEKKKPGEFKILNGLHLDKYLFPEFIDELLIIDPPQRFLNSLKLGVFSDPALKFIFQFIENRKPLFVGFLKNQPVDLVPYGLQPLGMDEIFQWGGGASDHPDKNLGSWLSKEEVISLAGFSRCLVGSIQGLTHEGRELIETGQIWHFERGVSLLLTTPGEKIPLSLERVPRLLWSSPFEVVHYPESHWVRYGLNEVMPQKNGAFTGCLSPQQLKDFDIRSVVIPYGSPLFIERVVGFLKLGFLVAVPLPPYYKPDPKILNDIPSGIDKGSCPGVLALDSALFSFFEKEDDFLISLIPLITTNLFLPSE